MVRLKTPILDSVIKEIEINITIFKDAMKREERYVATGAHARIESLTQAIYSTELYPDAYCWCGLKAHHDGNCKPLDEQ